MLQLTPKQYVCYIKKVAKQIEEQKDYITELDAQTGDGDHWLNLNSGFMKLCQEANRLETMKFSDKLSDDRFIKMSHDYELEQSNLKSMAEVLRKELKQQEQQKTNAKAFVSAVKKYTDMQELDAAVLREFIDRIEVSHADKKSKTREITIVYNFIGAFDFTRAIEEARNTTQKQQKTA